MKLNIVLASVCLIGAYGCVGAMDHKKDAYLKFELDKELHIVGHKAKNMNFLVAPEEFTGKVITETIPLEPQDLAAINSGFQKARAGGKKKEKVEYTLKDKQFVAAIKYKKDSFSVKVREAAPADKK